ncbi:hypothetical protein CK203_104028 [Vitis vinifera]|uniref:Uncharacterized protein n=1 Tax=Vitis vinifera TaxID=29760 RepID=A0A438FFU2_VITVI|nr:hypothetical protein CK203_104028 [Vitis vinifera]
MDIRAPAPTVPSTGPMPEVPYSTPPAIPGTPPVVPAISEPHPSESSLAISISEFRGLYTTAFGYSIAPEHDMPSLSGLHIHPRTSSSRVDYAPEETTTGQIEASIRASDFYSRAIVSA